MNFQNLVLGCALVFGTAACGGDSDEAFMEKSIGMMEGLAKVVEAADGDCGKMASSLEGFVSKNEGQMKELKAKAETMKTDKAKAEKMAKAAEKYKGRVEKVMPTIMGMMKCADDPKMKAMEDKLRAFM